MKGSAEVVKGHIEEAAAGAYKLYAPGGPHAGQDRGVTTSRQPKMAWRPASQEVRPEDRAKGCLHNQKKVFMDGSQRVRTVSTVSNSKFIAKNSCAKIKEVYHGTNTH
jgi:hypothetical protein